MMARPLRVETKQRGQVFILDNRIGNNGLSEPQNAQDAKLLAFVIFMLAIRIIVKWIH